MTAKRKGRIIILILVGIITAYAIAFIVYHAVIGRGEASSLVYIVLVCFSCAVFDFILIVSAFGLWGRLLRRLSRHDEATAYDTVVKSAAVDEEERMLSPQMTEEQKQAEKRERREKAFARYCEKREARDKFDLKFLIGGIFSFIVCCGVSVFMFWQRDKELTKYENNPNYVTTIAVAQAVRSDDDNGYSIEYVFTDESGKEYCLTNVGSFDGVSPRIGSELSVYYPVGKPESALSVEDAKMLLVGAVIFLSGGLCFLFLSIFQHNNSVICAVFGTTFAVFGGVGVWGAGMFAHVGFFGALMCGATAYGMTCFFILGSTLACYGYYSIVRDIHYYLKYLKKQKVSNDEI